MVYCYNCLFCYTWVKVFRIIPEFRILRMTFHRKSSSKCWIKEIILVSLINFQPVWGQIDHLNMKLWIFSGCTASFKIKISKVQDFGNFELSPMCYNKDIVGHQNVCSIHFKIVGFQWLNTFLVRNVNRHNNSVESDEMLQNSLF